MSVSNSVNSSPFSMVANVIIPEIEKFLDLPDGMGFSRVDRRVYACTKFPIKALAISSSSFNEVFATIRPSKFPHLISLQLSGTQYPDYLVPLRGFRLSLEIKGGIDLPGAVVDRVVSATGPLTGLKILDMSGGTQPFQFSQVAKSNLKTLRDLHCDNSSSFARAALGAIQDCTNLTSVYLRGQPISNELLIQLTLNHELAELNLQNACRVVDFGILSSCYSLRSFAPDKAINEENLIRILEANPEMENLDLSLCNAEMITDRLLETLATKNIKLKSLSLPRLLEKSSISDAAFIRFTENCNQIQRLQLGNLATITFAAIARGIKNCSELTNLSLDKINGEVLDAIATKKKLTVLIMMTYGSHFLEESLRGLIALKNLSTLSVGVCEHVTDQTIALFIESLPELHTLRVNWRRGGMTEPTLTRIKDHLKTGQSKLTFFSVYGTGFEESRMQNLLDDVDNLTTDFYSRAV